MQSQISIITKKTWMEKCNNAKTDFQFLSSSKTVSGMLFREQYARTRSRMIMLT